jgi:hypothetical protein|tara:strand:+ start:691 stop:1374 length:684 start_codon:yes stop_codon:yes gene_type:complete
MNELTTQTQANAMIQMAVEKGMTGEDLQALLAARREWEADEAKKAYNHALADFQREAPIVEKADDAHGKKYAALDRIWRTVRPLLTEKGLSVTWHETSIDVENKVCSIAGELAHRDGHSVTLKRDVPMPDIIRGQNAAQQAGSAETYGKRYALCAALGIVTGEDDDASSCGETITAKQMTELSGMLDQVDERDKVLTDLLDWASVDTLEDLPANKFATAKKAINAKL